MTDQCEKNVKDELMPFTFVAVKTEPMEDDQNDGRCFDSNLKDSLGECSGELNFIDERNIEEESTSQSKLQVKSEPKEDNNFSGERMRKDNVTNLCHELTTKESNPFVSSHEEHGMENNPSVVVGDSFCSEDYADREALNPEVKYGSTCDIPEAHVKVEKMESDLSSNDSVCDDSETLPFEPECQLFESGAQHFPVTGFQQNVNEEECDASTSKISTHFLLEIGNKIPEMCGSPASTSAQSIFCEESKQIKKNTKESGRCSQSDTILTSKKQIGSQPLVQGDPLDLQFKPQFHLRNEPEGNEHSHPSKIMNFSCSICPQSFKKVSYLRKHMLTHASDRPFECETCKKSFSLKTYLNEHMRTHTGERPFACEICKKSFCRKVDLNVHMRTHTGERPFECEICKKSFSTKGYLNVHVRSHTGDKPYECGTCKKSFSNQRACNVHMRTHTGDRPYPCEMCKKTFTTKGQMTVHMITHSGIRPYECEVCKKSLSSKRALNDHMRTHTGDRPFACEICGKTFTTKGQLNVHMRMHPGERPFECE